MALPEGAGTAVQVGVARSVPTGTVLAKPFPQKPPPPPRSYTGAQEHRKGNGTGSKPGGSGSSAAAAAAAAPAGGGGLTTSSKRLYALSNPPLHPKSETNFTYGMDAFGLRRGMIQRIAETAAGGEAAAIKLPPDQQYRFQFLYNPESISVSTAVDPGLVPPDSSTMSGEVVGRFAGQETWRFGLMLDRTQEAYEEGLPTRGTMVDIDALYRVVNGNEGNPGFLYLSAVRVYWGPWTQNGRPLPPFDGYITSINITHTKFTPRMCPIRSLVDLSIVRLTYLGADPKGG